MRDIFLTAGVLSLAMTAWALVRAVYPCQNRAVLLGVVASMLAAAPAAGSFFVLLGSGAAHASALAYLIRYWIVIGPLFPLVSYWILPWQATHRIESARLSHVVLWMFVSFLSLVAIFEDGPIR